MDFMHKLLFGRSGVGRWSVVFGVAVICSNFGCLQGVTWEMSIKQSEKDNDDTLASFHIESDQIRIHQMEDVYLTYSDPPSACYDLQGPPISRFYVNSPLILVVEYHGCDLISKTKNAKYAGYDGMILIRNGYGSNAQEAHLQNMNHDFNIFFADQDEGFNIRDFAMKNSNDPFRYKVKLRPVEVSGNWLNFDFDTTDATENLNHLYTRIDDCREFLIKNLDIIFASVILLTVACFIVYSMILAIWHEIRWIFRSIHEWIRPTPVIPVTPTEKPFVRLPEETWQESSSDLPSSCVICFEEFYPNDQLVRLPCRHLDFHRTCIHEWLRDPEHRTCPICREIVPDSSLDPKEFPPRPAPYIDEDQMFMNDINNDLINLILDQIIVNSTDPHTTARARVILNNRNIV